ncbi:conserved Plasmodium protein, unknown function [Plasmodium ovale]|uniref:Uncharacterized protein n=1 Tax=Plasmodium ovale TaxID=36330 RepID=A0A1D3KWZ8_PLAOA|nr:conserved Plasmodium protein, unknown function [Plasmodium ovale]
MSHTQRDRSHLKTLLNTKDDDLFNLFKNTRALGAHRRKKKTEPLNELIYRFLCDDNDVFDKHTPCELDQERDASSREVNGEAVHEERRSSQHVANTGKGNNIRTPIYMDENYNNVMFLSRKNIDSDCFHLKKIRKECNKIYNDLKFYKIENHDVYKFRPHDTDTDVIKLKHDLDSLQHNNYDICNVYDEEKKNALRIVQEKCKKIVQSLNFNCNSVDISDIIDVLNIITTPGFDERLDKYKYLKLFVNKYHYVYPYEDIGGLRKIRNYVKRNYMNKGNFYINEDDISQMYLHTDLEKIIKNDNFVNNMLNLHIDNGKFWIQLIHNIWIPLIVQQFGSAHFSFFSYLVNYDNDASAFKQYALSMENEKFYKFAHNIFTGALFSGIPSIYRLLMRLHAYKYAEIRINMILVTNSKKIYNEEVVSSLNYHIDIIRNLFPFFKEFQNINMEQIVENFFQSRFFKIVISSLKKKNIEKIILNQKYINFINSFFLMITEFLYGVLNKKCLEKINSNNSNGNNSNSNNSNIKLLNIMNKIFYENMNIQICRDILLFIADLLCLFKLNCIYIKKKYCNIILDITNIVKMFYYNKYSLVNENSWKQVYVIAVKINHFINCALQRTQTINDNIMLQELSIINRYYFTNLKEENSIGEFYFLKNTNYGIYCWNSLCNKYTNTHIFEYNKHTFQYCNGCYIATYCSEKCKLIHLLSSHHNVCVYFKTIPSFLKFNILNTGCNNNYHDMHFLNMFQNIDVFNRENESYHIIY